MGKKIELPLDVESRLMSCQNEEIQAKIDACLDKSCSEFSACLSSLGQGGGGGEEGQEQAPNLAISAKAQSCQSQQQPSQEIKPPKQEYPAEFPGESPSEVPITDELCANFSNVPACSYAGSPDSQNYQLCKKCYPDR